MNCLNFLHSTGILHCDIKPENILFDIDRKRVKIIDFGNATFYNDLNFTYIQTRPYRAPELIFGNKYDYSIDIWSLGCLIYELLTFRFLFDYTNIQSNIAKALAINKQYDLSLYKNGKGKDSVILKNRYLYLESKEEGSFEVILPKENFSIRKELQDLEVDEDLIDLVEKCLKLNPIERPTCQEALNHVFMIKNFKPI